jgi:hypothetical protein
MQLDVEQLPVKCILCGEPGGACEEGGWVVVYYVGQGEDKPRRQDLFVVYGLCSSCDNGMDGCVEAERRVQEALAAL